MKKIITKSVSVFMSVILLSACSSEISIGEQINAMLDSFVREDTTQAIEEKMPGGEVVEVSNTFALGVTEFDTWNPLTTQSVTVREAMELVYEPLYEIDQNHHAVGVLASDYWVSTDGKTIEVTLKDGVKWHDGDSLDAYDAAYTVKHILNGDTTYTSLLSEIEDYKALNARIIRFKLKRSIPDFASLLTFPIVKYKSDMTNKAEPIGTGPYSYYGRLSTDKYMFTANDRYHGGRPAVDAVYITSVPDTEKYNLMFEASEFDLMTDSTMDLSEGMPNGNLTLYDYVTDRMCYIGFNTKSSVLDNPETRRGLAYLIDKDAIVSKLIYSRGVPVDIPINPSSYLYYDISRSFGIEYENAYDEFEKAGWESKERGFTREINGITEKLEIILLVNEDNRRQVQIAEYIEADMERYGVSVVLDEQPQDVYLSKIGARNYDAFLGEVALGANGDLTPLTGRDNVFSYSSTDVNTIITQCGMCKDDEGRKSLFIQLGQKITEDMPFVPIYFFKGSVIAGTKIKSKIEPSVSADYRNSSQWRVK